VLEPPVTTLAPLGRRLAARLLDGLVLTPILVLLVGLTGGFPEGGRSFAMPDTAFRLYWLVVVAYEVGLIALSGQTLGKRWLGIRVVDATTGAVPNLDQAGRRAAPSLLGIVPFLGTLAPLLYLPALWQPRRQGFHDSLAATVVVRVERIKP
jgi:uncharacterized RDD family membrane protein YckC